LNNLTASQIHAVVRSAVLAPSADNRHHVAFEPTAGGMRIWADDQYANCAEPHRRQLTVFSYATDGSIETGRQKPFSTLRSHHSAQ